MIDFSSWKDAVTNPWLALAIALSCVVLLLLPQEWLSDDAISAIMREYRGWIFLVGVSSGVVAVVSLLRWGSAKIGLLYRARITKKREEEKREQRRSSLQSYLTTLTDHERMILWNCVSTNTRTITVRMNETAPRSLKDKGFLSMHGGAGDPLRWPFTVPNLAWEVLRTEREHILTAEQNNDRQLAVKVEQLMYDLTEESYF